jgi:glutamine---fructose-6-phosphate transaminase (isomerizing)
MCGIVGYVGPRPVGDIIMPGLERLEYRGYDSAGLAVLEAGSLVVERRAGRIEALKAAVAGRFGDAHTGIGHTRWATHGAPTEGNAHPHLDCHGAVAVVHNGIIENHAALRDQLVAAGHVFRSATDTEVLSHLVESMAELPLAEAVRRAMRMVEGALAVAVIRTDEPDLIVAARRGSPLVLGVGDGEAFVASDMPAILGHTRRMVVVEDDRVAVVTPAGVTVTDLDGNEVEAPERLVEWDLEAAEKGGYEDFMLKEIHEQPTALRDTLRGRLDPAGRVVLDELPLGGRAARSFDKVFVVACGTSFHAAMMAKYAIERWTRLPVEIDIASEFRYRDPVVDEHTLVVGISQSGETADTLAATRYAKVQGAFVVAVTNVVDSSIARDAHAVLYTRSGPEIGVAATKTFISQLVALQLLALYLAQERGSISAGRVVGLVEAIGKLPDQVAEILERDDEFTDLAKRWANLDDFFFLGRGVSCATAAEGALKLKEISYARAEYYPAGEMKHGPIALIDDEAVVVGVIPKGDLHAKALANMEEMRARGANLLLVLTDGDLEGAALADHVIFLPETEELLTPVLGVVPLQLLSYRIAKARGLDVDKPRNLAKTVTVE